MASYPRTEVERAFQVYWQTGAVREDWSAWADLFTDDAVHVEHVLGTHRGRESIRRWIVPTMARVPELYAALGWYAIDGDRVVCEAINRRDDPSPGGGCIDFPGVTILRYAGAGRWSYEEDYWVPAEAKGATERYLEACAAHDPGHAARRTRLNWPKDPPFAAPGWQP